MALDQIVKTKRDGTITIIDGAGTPKTLTVDFEAGDLNISIPGPAVNVFLNRGQFGTTPSLRYGDSQPCTGTFTAYMRDLIDATEATLEGIVTNTGYFASDWISTLDSAGNAEVKTVKIVFALEGTDHGGTDQAITLDDCHLTGSLSEGDPNMINVSFTAYMDFPTIAAV